MKILIVEDDENKLERLSGYLAGLPDGHQIERRRSYKSGLSAMRTEQFDLVVLDMSLPIFDITSEEDGFEFEPFAGRDLLAEMKRNQVQTKVLIVTQFEAFGEGEEAIRLPALSAQLAKSFPDLYLGSVYYTPSQSSWKDDIADHLSRLC
jgi:CheY-like chemotaxis protein